MDLKDFIKQTLVDIISGIEEAQKEVSKYEGAAIVPIRSQYNRKSETVGHVDGAARVMTIVDFDIAVEAENKISGDAKAGIAVVGGKASAERSSGSVSRIQFEVPIVLPETKQK